MTQRASKLFLLLAFTVLLGSCSLGDDFKSIAKEMANALPAELLDTNLQTLYALRQGDVEKAIDAQEEILQVLVSAVQLSAGQNLNHRQQKNLELAAAYLQQYPPKKTERAKP
jgi:low temperature requirement protein LtrA